MEAFFLLLLGLLGAAGLFLRSKPKDDRLRAWQDAAEACALEDVDVYGWNPQLKARAGPMNVRIEALGEKGRSTRVVIVVPGPLDFASVRLRPELSSPLTRGFEVGDAPFDSAFSVGGPVPLVFALLDAEMRRLLLGLNVESRVEISLGALRADISDERLPALLPRLIDAGQRLAQSMEVPVSRRLAENAKGDPEAGVRLHNLLILIQELPEDRITVEALRAACSDPSPEIRLQAAGELGAEGHGVLFELAESLVTDAVSAEAVSVLDRDLPFERAKALLDRALSGRHLQTARACLEALGKSGAVAVDTLAQVLDQEKGELATAAAQALGEIGSPDAEPLLIRALEREPAGLRVAAANALARVGSAAAVLPLKDAAERSLLDLDLRRATHQAIAEIQSRLQGASPGQLSLAGSEAGRLSLASDPAGQVSLSDDEREPKTGRPE